MVRLFIMSPLMGLEIRSNKMIEKNSFFGFEKKSGFDYTTLFNWVIHVKELNKIKPWKVN